MFISSTGDGGDGGYTYKINGVVISEPHAWDSRQFGTTNPQSVVFEVSGVDPDCGNTVTAINSIEVDNTCAFNEPSLTDSIDSDSNGVDFEPSYFPDPSTITDAGFSVAGDNRSATIALGGHESAVIELAVTAASGATEWNVNDTQVTVTADSGSSSRTVSTKVFLVSPITHNSVTTDSAKWGGTTDADGNTVTQGNWGTSEADSKYGNFDCLTCHEKGGPNVKWMKGTIDMPADSGDGTWGTSGLASLPIIFQDARQGSDDWGNDVGEMPRVNDMGTPGDPSDDLYDINHSFNVFEKVPDVDVVPADGTPERQIYDTATAAPNTGAAATYKGAVMGETGNFAPSEVYDSYGTCSNIACHYGVQTPPWNSGPATCTTCHNNGTDDGSLTNAAPATGDHDAHMVAAPGSLSEKMINGFINKCESCHGGGANTGDHPGHLGASYATSPVDLSDYVDFGGMTCDSGTPTCTSLCHEASTAGIWGSGVPLPCEAFHMAPYLGPTVVDPDNEGTGLASGSGFGSHLKGSTGDSISTGTHWYSQCTKCHPYHTGGVEIPEPPTNWDNPGTAATESDNMAYKLGLQFPITGGIHLGGSATSGTTEADICWNCHGTDSEINEWGYNADTNGPSWPETRIAPDTTTPAGHTYWDDAGARGSYNYGYLYTSNHSTGTYTAGTATSKWVDGSGWGNYRRDGYQHSSNTNPGYILSRRITSVHSVNFTSGKQVSSVDTAIDASGNVVPAAPRGATPRPSLRGTPPGTAPAASAPTPVAAVWPTASPVPSATAPTQPACRLCSSPTASTGRYRPGRWATPIPWTARPSTAIAMKAPSPAGTV